MSREKLSWPWIIAACPPMTAACAASELPPRLAASTPTIIAAMPTSDWRDEFTMLRAMWRWETCESSCASTEASSSRDAVMAMRPR